MLLMLIYIYIYIIEREKETFMQVVIRLYVLYRFCIGVYKCFASVCMTFMFLYVCTGACMFLRVLCWFYMSPVGLCFICLL